MEWGQRDDQIGPPQLSSPPVWNGQQMGLDAFEGTGRSQTPPKKRNLARECFPVGRFRDAFPWLFKVRKTLTFPPNT